jgi:hypothetical protein
MQITISLNPQQQALIAAHPGRAVILLSPEPDEWGFNVLNTFPQDSDFMYYEVPVQVCAESAGLTVAQEEPQRIAVQHSEPGATRTLNQRIKSRVE